MAHSHPEPKPRQRVIFLDAARCLAIVLMIFAHMSDALVAQSEYGTAFEKIYRHLRGIAAPLFFFISGWAFAVVTLPKFSEHRRFGPAVRSRLWRAALLGFWGSVLTLPWWAEGFPFNARAEVWHPFLTFGVLHCIAGALLIGQLLIRLTPSPSVYAIVASVLAVVAVVAAAPVQAWASQLAPEIRGALYAGSFTGGFPLFPWAGFFLLGSAMSAWVFVQRATPAFVASLLAVVSVVSLGLGHVLTPAAKIWVGDQMWVTSPSLFLQRLGTTAGILALVALASLRMRTPWPVLSVASAHALTFYVGHMMIIWGVPYVTGLQHRLGPKLSFAQSGLLTASCLTVLLGVAWAMKRFSARSSARAVSLPASTPPAGPAIESAASQQ